MTNIIYDNYNLFLTDLKNIDVLIHKKTNVNHISIANKLFIIHKNIIDEKQNIIQNKNINKNDKTTILQLYKYLGQYIDILYKYNDNKEQVSLRKNFRILTVINIPSFRINNWVLWYEF